MKSYFQLFFLLILLFSCNKDKNNDQAIILMGEVSQIDASGAILQLKITDLGQSDILDFGFVWDSSNDPFIEKGEHSSMNLKAKLGIFSTKICTGLVSGKTYYAKGYVKTSTGIVYTNEVHFISAGGSPCSILSFYPSMGDINDTVTIVGNYFSYNKSENKVLFTSIDNKEVVSPTLIYASQDTLKVIAPEIYPNQWKISVSVLNGATSSFIQSFYTINDPKILEFSPTYVNIGDTITLKGLHFSPFKNQNYVNMGDLNANICYSSSTMIKAIVPSALPSGKSILKVMIHTKPFYSSKELNMIPLSINSFTPNYGNLGDTIVLRGTGFSPVKEEDVISFGDKAAQVLSASINQIKCIVPTSVNQSACAIAIFIQGKVYTTDANFYLRRPIIMGFSPETASFGDVLSILGSCFGSSKTNLSVTFDKEPAEVVSVKDNEIQVKVPSSIQTTSVRITVGVNNMISNSPNLFNLKPFSIADFYPKTMTTGGHIKITGSGFSTDPTLNSVKIGGLQATVASATLTELDVVVPTQDKGAFGSRDVEVSVAVANTELKFQNKLLINDKWFRHQDISYPDYSNNNYLATTNGKFYLGLWNSNDLYEYNPLTNTLTKLATFPGTARYNIAAIAMGNKIYFGTGMTGSMDYLSDFWEYDTDANQWTQKSDFKGSSRFRAFGFSIKNKIYLGGGIHSENWDYNVQAAPDFWSYDPQTDVWSTINSFNNTQYDSDDLSQLSSTIVINDKAYIGLISNSSVGNDKWFVYDPAVNAWSKLADFPEPHTYAPSTTIFSVNETIYLRNAQSSFYAYDIAQNSWSIVDSKYIPQEGVSYGCAIGKIVYLGLWNELWEFDPSRQ